MCLTGFRFLWFACRIKSCAYKNNSCAYRNIFFSVGFPDIFKTQQAGQNIPSCMKNFNSILNRNCRFSKFIIPTGIPRTDREYADWTIYLWLIFWTAILCLILLQVFYYSGPRYKLSEALISGISQLLPVSLFHPYAISPKVLTAWLCHFFQTALYRV